MKEFKRASPKPIGQLLIEHGVITREQLDMALEHQKERKKLIGEVLVELNFATEQDIVQALTSQYGMPYLPLAQYEIDPTVLLLIPESICRQYCLIPIDKIGKSLTLAMANPLNARAIEEVERQTGCLIQTFVSTSTEVLQAIDKYYKIAKS
ncbi:MAG TPA: hypothetical protein PLH56_03880 [Candidatus Omnitrophota bacterium]|nr:hypothetical protein [Candidatus Omnitrophota bacterium]